MEKKAIEWRFPGGWRRSLASVLIGNLLYYALVDAVLPEASRQPLGINWGLGIDFLLCLAVYFLTARFW